MLVCIFRSLQLYKSSWFRDLGFGFHYYKPRTAVVANPTASASKEVSLDNIIEGNFCSPGQSLIHSSFYNGDTVINFQLKHLLWRRNRKRKWVRKLSNKISTSKSTSKFAKEDEESLQYLLRNAAVVFTCWGHRRFIPKEITAECIY